MADEAGSTVADVADRARETPDVLRRETRGNPLAAGLVAFGAGLIVSTLIPPSEPERQAASALQEQLEPVTDRVIETGREVAQQAQSAAQEGLEHVKDTATGATEQLKQGAKTAGQEVTQQARDSADEIRDANGDGYR